MFNKYTSINTNNNCQAIIRLFKWLFWLCIDFISKLLNNNTYYISI